MYIKNNLKSQERKKIGRIKKNVGKKQKINQEYFKTKKKKMIVKKRRDGTRYGSTVVMVMVATVQQSK